MFCLPYLWTATSCDQDGGIIFMSGLCVWADVCGGVCVCVIAKCNPGEKKIGKELQEKVSMFSQIIKL